MLTMFTPGDTAWNSARLTVHNIVPVATSVRAISGTATFLHDTTCTAFAKECISNLPSGSRNTSRIRLSSAGTLENKWICKSVLLVFGEVLVEHCSLQPLSVKHWNPFSARALSCSPTVVFAAVCAMIRRWNHKQWWKHWCITDVSCGLRRLWLDLCCEIGLNASNVLEESAGLS